MTHRKFRVASAISLLSILSLFITICGARAQDVISEVTAPVSPILHRPFGSSELPPPGKLITISMSIKDRRDLDLRVQALVTRDGKLMSVPVSRSYLNDQDFATYDFNLFAPLAEMSYIFVLYSHDAAPRSSRRYVVRRACLPKVELTQLTPPQAENQKGELERMRELLDHAKGLETDVSNYENALKILKEIQAGVPQ